MIKFNGIKIIEHKGFSLMYVESPPRLEAKVVFGREHISQKLVFTLMEITHAHGFACSRPHFLEKNEEMSFLIGTRLPTSLVSKKYLNRLTDCLLEIKDFSKEFQDQLDFSYLDISMFSKEDLDNFYPEHMSAIRDQLYDGSWKKYKKSIENESKIQADLIKKCIVFEKINNKDIGYVGHKLGELLYFLNDDIETEN